MANNRVGRNRKKGNNPGVGSQRHGKLDRHKLPSLLESFFKGSGMGVFLNQMWWV